MNAEQSGTGRFARAKFAADKKAIKNLSIVQELNENLKAFKARSSNDSISSLSNESSSTSFVP